VRRRTVCFSGFNDFATGDIMASFSDVDGVDVDADGMKRVNFDKSHALLG